MHICKIGFGRTINTGNFESYKASIEVDVAEGESGADALKKAIRFVDDACLKVIPARPVPAPPTPVKEIAAPPEEIPAAPVTGGTPLPDGKGGDTKDDDDPFLD